ncbi:MAG: AAA family ATPase [SAR324 cluster bacterium]|nr:AAA family ATPase [SAR324 cluster bacterium]
MSLSIPEIAIALDNEISETSNKSRTPKNILVEKVTYLGNVAQGFLYQLELESSLNAQAEQPISISSSGNIVKGRVLDSKDYELLVYLEEKIGEEGVRIVKSSLDPSIFLRVLKNRLLEDRWIDEDYPQKILKQDFPPSSSQPLRPNPQFNSSQQQAIAKSLHSEFHLIWGPPGTGKTRTLGEIISQLIQKNRSCLVLSISNIAVDQLIKAVIDHTPRSFREDVLRFGIPLDKSLDLYTLRGKSLAKDPRLKEKFRLLLEEREKLRGMVRSKRGNLVRSKENSKNYNVFSDELSSQFSKINRIETELTILERSIHKESQELLKDCLCVGTTLASFIMNPEIYQLAFDVVVIDEASMVPMVYVLAAAKMVSRQFIIAGDPEQLPPISICDNALVRKWIGSNIFDFFKVNQPDQHPNVSFLKEQYRMQNAISDLVSSLSYDNKLQSRSKAGEADITIVDIDPQKLKVAEQYYSVKDKSYYFPVSVFITSALLSIRPLFKNKRMLFLSPFRSQVKLMSKFGSDLGTNRFESRTIHKSQGDESPVVIIDFTMYSDDPRNPFFENEQNARRLLNVAMSRAQESLVLLLNTRMLVTLGNKYAYYRELKNKLKPFPTVEAFNFLGNFALRNHVFEHLQSEKTELLYVASSHDSALNIQNIAEKFRQSNSSNPVVVCQEHHVEHSIGGILWRTERDISKFPHFATGGGHLFYCLNNQWHRIRCPEVANGMKHLAVGHLLEEEISIEKDGKRLVCDYCGGTLEIQSKNKMTCSSENCHKERFLQKKDIEVLIELYDVRCPACYIKMTPRIRNGEYFIGCQNYPRCKEVKPL